MSNERKIVNFVAEKHYKEGKVSVDTIVTDLSREYSMGHVKEVIVVFVNQEGIVHTGWSGESVHALGMLDVGRFSVNNKMRNSN